MAAAGLAAPGSDPPVRAAFLLVNGLAVLLLRDHLTEVLGTDALTGAGMRRWAGEVLASYGAGLLAAPSRGPLAGSPTVQDANEAIAGEGSGVAR